MYRYEIPWLYAAIMFWVAHGKKFMGFEQSHKYRSIDTLLVFSVILKVICMRDRQPLETKAPVDRDDPMIRTLLDEYDMTEAEAGLIAGFARGKWIGEVRKDIGLRCADVVPIFALAMQKLRTVPNFGGLEFGYCGNNLVADDLSPYRTEEGDERYLRQLFPGMRKTMSKALVMLSRDRTVPEIAEALGTDELGALRLLADAFKRTYLHHYDIWIWDGHKSDWDSRRRKKRKW